MSWKPNTVKLDVEDGWTMERCLNAVRKSTMQECTGSDCKVPISARGVSMSKSCASCII